jgi:SAM-dependent methyltransferase
MSDADLFATVAREYAAFRPGYPPGLFAWLAGQCARLDAVWDCGCGSGQASLALAEHFTRVYATDLSARQIAAATPHARVHFTVAPAGNSGLADACVDLVTVAQALHWFDVAAFYAEARRVARPGALLAVWTYPRPRFAEPALEREFADFYQNVVGPCWPPQRRHVESNYTTLPFPFAELPHPGFGLELFWSLEQVLGYVSSWSATARYKQKGTDPVPWLRERLAARWPPGAAQMLLHMPLGLRVARLVRSDP